MLKKATMLSCIQNEVSYSGNIVIGIGYFDPNAEELKETGRGFSRDQYGKLAPENKRVISAYSNSDVFTVVLDLKDYVKDDLAHVYRCEIEIGDKKESGFLIPSYKWESLSGNFNYEFSLPSEEKLFTFYLEVPDEVGIFGVMDDKKYHSIGLSFPTKIVKSFNNNAGYPEYLKNGSSLTRPTITTSSLLSGEKIRFAYRLVEEVMGGGKHLVFCTSNRSLFREAA